MASTEQKKPSPIDTDACNSPAANNDVGSTDHISWLNNTLDVKLRSMEEKLERKLRESFSSDRNGSKDKKDTRETSHAQSEAQQKINRKIGQLEKSLMELGRKQRKHQTAFVDLRSISVVLKDTLSGIIRLVETLGAVVEPQIQDHSKLSTRVGSVEKCLLDAGILKNDEAVPSEVALPSHRILSDFIVEGEFRNSCTELSEKVNQISRDFLWLDTREAGDDSDSKAISNRQQLSLPSSPQVVKDDSHRSGATSAAPVRAAAVSPRPTSMATSPRVSKALPIQDVGSSSQSPTEVKKSSLGSSVQLLPANTSVVQQAPLASVPSWARTDIGMQLPLGSAGLSASMPAITSGNLGVSTRVLSASAGSMTGSIRVLHGTARSRSGSPSGAPTHPSYKASYSARSRSISPSEVRTQQSSYTPSVTMPHAYSTTGVPSGAQTQQSSYTPSVTMPYAYSTTNVPSGAQTQQSSYTPSVTMPYAYSTTSVSSGAQTQHSSSTPSATTTNLYLNDNRAGRGRSPSPSVGVGANSKNATTPK